MCLGPILAGLFGGFVRSVVGIAKYLSETKKSGGKIKWVYLIFSLMVAGATGAFAGLIASNDWRFAALAGYAGTDLAEGLFQLARKHKRDPHRRS